MNLEIGSTLGDYQIIGILGAGGMGRVYKVRNVISDRIEAMKVLLPDLATAPELADRFMREIKVQASLEHPNIAVPAHRRAGGQPAADADGVPGRRDPGAAAPSRAGFRCAEAVEYITPGAGGARLRAPARRDSSRHQAGQHDAGLRDGEADGFRHRQGGRRPAAHHDRHHHGLAVLHVAGADQGSVRPGCARGPVLGGSVALRAGDRQAAVRWRQPVRHHVGAPGKEPGAAGDPRSRACRSRSTT